MEQRHHIVTIDHLPRHGDGLRLAAGNTAKKCKRRFIAACTAQELIADHRDDNSRRDHRAECQPPLACLRQHRLIEGGADQHAEAKDNRLVEPAGDTKMLAQWLHQTAAKPDAEQASHQIGRRYAELQACPPAGKGDGEGYEQTAQIADQLRLQEGPRVIRHFSRAPDLPSG